MPGRLLMQPAVMGPAPSIDMAYEFFDDFFSILMSTTADASVWHQTGDVSGTNADILDDLRGGVARQMTGATIGHTCHWALNGSPFLPAVGRNIACAGRSKLVDADKANIAMGITDDGITDVIDDAVKDGVGFVTAGNNAALLAFVGNGTAETESASVLTLTDGDFFEWAFFIHERDYVDFYINEDRVATIAGANLPDTWCTLFLEVETEESAGNEFDHDRVYIADWDK